MLFFFFLDCWPLRWVEAFVFLGPCKPRSRHCGCCAASNKPSHGEVAVQHEARGAHIQQLSDRFICLHPLSRLHHLKWFKIANSPEMILFLSRCRHDPDPLLSVIPLTFLWLFKPMVSIQYHFPLCVRKKSTRFWSEAVRIWRSDYWQTSTLLSTVYIGWDVTASFTHCPTRTCKFSMNGNVVLGQTTTPLLTCVCLTSDLESQWQQTCKNSWWSDYSQVRIFHWLFFGHRGPISMRIRCFIVVVMWGVQKLNKDGSELSLVDSVPFCFWRGQLLGWTDLTSEPGHLSWSVISDLWLSGADRLLREINCLESGRGVPPHIGPGGLFSFLCTSEFISAS